MGQSYLSFDDIIGFGAPQGDESEKDSQESILRAYSLTKDSKIPSTYRVPRHTLYTLLKVQRELFDYEAMKQGVAVIRVDEKDRATFARFRRAMAQTLYNASYISGNTDTNSGLTRIQQEGGGFYGIIATTLYDICKKAYGTKRPSLRQEKEMEDFIEDWNKKDIEIPTPDGGVDLVPLFVRAKHQPKKGSMKNRGTATYYKFALNPIFCGDIIKNYALYPQRGEEFLMETLKKRGERWTISHDLFMDIAGAQDRRKPFVRNIETLVEELELTAEYKKNRLRTEQRIVKILESAKEAYEIKDFSLTHSLSARGAKYISRIVCTFHETEEKKAQEKDKK